MLRPILCTEIADSGCERCNRRTERRMLSDPACTHAGIYAGISAVGGGYDIIRASHGGIIGLPGIGGLITPQAVLFPKYAGGIYREGKHIGIVSRGLGTHTVNLRFCNPAELVSVSLEFHSCENVDNPV